MYVIIDTNVLRTDFLFQSEYYKLFSEFIKRTKSTLVIPRIVFEEACCLYKKEFETKKKNFRKALSDILYFGKHNSSHFANDFIENIKPDYEKILYEIFLYHWEIIEYNNIQISELVRRAIYRIKPCSNSGEGFRDTIIWLSIIDFLDKNSSHKSIFISNDRKAFSDESNQDLHTTLKKDLSTNNLELFFCNSLGQFINEYTTEAFFFSKDWVINHIHWNEINRQVREAVETIHCGYFFTLYERTINKHWDYYYEVRNVEINKEWLKYYIYEKKDQKFTLELHFFGLATIDFFLDNDEIKTVSAEFFTETMAVCTKDAILEYSGNYYEEESGLALPEPIL